MTDFLLVTKEKPSLLLVAFVPLIMMVAFTVAYVTNRASQVDLGILVLLLLPLFWLFRLPKTKISDAGQQVFIGLWIAWSLELIFVQALSPVSIMSGWWKFSEKSAAFVVFLLIISTCHSAKTLLTLLGAASALAATVTCTVSILMGRLGDMGAALYGFGHLNILMCTIGPAVIAWSVVMIADFKAGKKVPLAVTLTWILGCTSLFLLAYATQRRGISLALAAIASWLIAAWLWKKLNKAGKYIAVSFVIVAIIAVVYKISLWDPSQIIGRNERIGLYIMGLDGFLGGLPWGFGNYGMLHLQHLPYESTKHMIAMGTWGMHVHNEFLDAGLDGGMPALLLVVFMSILTVIRVWTIADPTMRLACQAGSIAIFIHLLTDNTYGEAYGQFWMGIMLGVFWLAESRPKEGGGFLTPLKRFPSAYLLALPLVLVSTYGAVTSFYPAVISNTSSAEIRFKALKLSLEPQLVNKFTLDLLSEESKAQAMRRSLIDVSVRKLGWNMALAREEATYYINESVGSEQGVKAFVRFLEFEPFSRTIYNELRKYLERFPQTAKFLPKETQVRLLYISGTPGLKKPDIFVVPKNIYAAQDLEAALIWHILNGTSWQEIAHGVKNLTDQYGNIPDIAQFAFEVTREAPKGTFSWSEAELIRLNYGLAREQLELRDLLQKVKTPTQARAIKCFITHVYPNMESDFTHHTISPQTRKMLVSDNDVIPAYAEAIRCYALSESAVIPR